MSSNRPECGSTPGSSHAPSIAFRLAVWCIVWAFITAVSVLFLVVVL